MGADRHSSCSEISCLEGVNVTWFLRMRVDQWPTRVLYDRTKGTTNIYITVFIATQQLLAIPVDLYFILTFFVWRSKYGKSILPYG